MTDEPPPISTPTDTETNEDDATTVVLSQQPNRRWSRSSNNANSFRHRHSSSARRRGSSGSSFLLGGLAPSDDTISLVKPSLELQREERWKAAYPTLGKKLPFDTIGLVERSTEIATLQECLQRVVAVAATTTTFAGDGDATSFDQEQECTTKISAKRQDDDDDDAESSDECQQQQQQQQQHRVKEIVFIHGESGTGKSTLATTALREKVVERQGGTFVTGKCDIQLRHQPLSIILQACSEICEDLLLRREPALLVDIRRDLQKLLDRQLLELLEEDIPCFSKLAVIITDATVPPDTDVHHEHCASPQVDSSGRGSYCESERSASFSHGSGNSMKPVSLGRFSHGIRKLFQRNGRRKSGVGSSGSLSDQDISFTSRRGHLDATSLKELLQYAIRGFLRVISIHLGPLVLFFDDLQWAETSSLEMIAAVAQDPSIESLMVVGCYRSEDVDDDHPLGQLTNTLKETNTLQYRYTEMSVGCLSVDGITTMVTDLLSVSDEGKAQQLAKIVWKRTLGNALFVRNYLAMLQDDELVSFDLIRCRWDWDASEVEKETVATDNVVDVIRKKLSKFSKDLICLLQIASFLGTTFAKSVLILLCMQMEDGGYAFDVRLTEIDINETIDAAVREMLIEPAGDDSIYKFTHDKIQEAVIDLLPDENLDMFRTAIGNCLIHGLDEDQLEDMVFVIVDLLRQDDIHSIEIAKLCLIAAEKARQLSAFNSAVSFVEHGLANLQGHSAWKCFPVLAVRLHSVGAEAEECIGNTTKANFHIQEVRAQYMIPTVLKMRVNEVLVERLYSDGEYNQLWHTCHAILQDLGVFLPRSHIRQRLQAKFALRQTKRSHLLLSKISENIEIVSDPLRLEAISFMARLASFALASKNKPLYTLLCCKCVQWTGKYGLTKYTASILGSFANVLMHEDGDWRTAVQVAHFALSIETQIRSKHTRASTLQKTTSFVLGWVHPLRNCRVKYLEAYKDGMLSGNMEAVGMSVLFLVVSQYFSGEVGLSGLEDDIRRYVYQLERCRLHTYVLGLRLMWQKVLNLLGTEFIQQTSSLDGTAMEGIDVQRHRFIFNTVGKHHVCNLCAIFSEHEKGANVALEMEDSFCRTWAGASYFGFDPFSRAICLYAMAMRSRQKKFLKAARRARSTILKWVKKGAVNLFHQLLILDAEETIVQGFFSQTKEAYLKAIGASVRAGFLADAGIASERLATFLVQRNITQDAKHHIHESIQYFGRWGASRKVEMLQETFKDILAKEHDLIARSNPNVYNVKSGSLARSLGAIHGRALALSSLFLLVVFISVASATSPTLSTSDWISASLSCPSVSFLGDELKCCCSILDFGAIGDNITMNTVAIQTAIDSCHARCEHVTRQRRLTHSHPNLEDGENDMHVMVYVPPGNYQTGSILLKSNLHFHLAHGAALYGSTHTYDYPIVPMLPKGYVTGKDAMWRALIAGYDLENVSVTGENNGAPGSASVIDGVGWKWWCWARSFPLPQPFCQKLNPSNATIPKQMMRPKMIEFYNSTNIVLQQFTVQNSPNWNIHPFACRNVTMRNLTILAPRSIGNTDGIDPDSCVDVVMDSCYIDVGDDAVSIKSTNVTPGVMWPTRNVYMTNLTILSRNWCIGSATFGGISNIVFEDSRIGSTEEVTSPWAIKFKSHRYFPGPMENITIRRIVMGKIGPTPWMYPMVPGYAFQVGLSYNTDANPSQRSGFPLFRNVTFEDIIVTSAGVAGNFHGLPEDCLQGLTLRNVSVLGGKATWNCDNVDITSFQAHNVHPPVTCTGGCNNTASKES